MSHNDAFYLIVATKPVHKEKHRMTSMSMLGKGKFMFQTCFIEVAKL